MNRCLTIATWAIGPSYRRRAIKNIRATLAEKNVKNIKYVILTDMPSDFDSIVDEIKEIIEVDVVDVFEIINKYNVNVSSYEFIPKSKVNPEYIQEWRQKVGHFSYNIKGLVLLRLAEVNITQFFLIDPDQLITIPLNDEEEKIFWEKLDIQNQSMLSSSLECLTTRRDLQTYEFCFPSSRAMGATNHFVRNACLIVYLATVELNKKLGTRIKFLPTEYELVLSEGPIKFFNFSTVEKLTSYFWTWNELVYIQHNIPELNPSIICGGGWSTSDFSSIALANFIEDVHIVRSEILREVSKSHVFFEDRHFNPNVNGLIPSDSIKEFAEKNRKFLENQYQLLNKTFSDLSDILD